METPDRRSFRARCVAAACARALLLLCTAVALLAPGTPTRLASAATAAAWPQAGYSATHAGFNRGERAITAANVGELVEHWHVDGVRSAGDPVVADGRIFVAGGPTVWAFATEDGAQLWTTTYEGENDCCVLRDPVVAPDGTVTTELGWLGGGGSLRLAPVTGQVLGGGPEVHSGSRAFTVRDRDLFWLGYEFGSGGPFLASLHGTHTRASSTSATSGHPSSALRSSAATRSSGSARPAAAVSWSRSMSSSVPTCTRSSRSAYRRGRHRCRRRHRTGSSIRSASGTPS